MPFEPAGVFDVWIFAGIPRVKMLVHAVNLGNSVCESRSDVLVTLYYNSTGAIGSRGKCPLCLCAPTLEQSAGPDLTPSNNIA